MNGKEELVLHIGLIFKVIPFGIPLKLFLDMEPRSSPDNVAMREYFREGLKCGLSSRN